MKKYVVTCFAVALLGGCVVPPHPRHLPPPPHKVMGPPGPMVPAGVFVPPGVVYVSPVYESPAPGYVWVHDHHRVWGWHHQKHGWHRGHGHRDHGHRG